MGLFAFRPLTGKQKKKTLCALCDFAVNHYCQLIRTSNAHVK
jgi:hypothetical protein